MSFIDDYRKMAKPRAVEEWADIYLIRPLGYLFVQVLRHTPLTPTMVSGLAVLAGWWTAWIYYLSNSRGGDVSLALFAVLTFLLHSALDSADGQLARLTGRTTQFGRIVDGFCDSLAFLSIYIAIVASTWVRSPQYGIIVTVLAFPAVYMHSLQSSLTEYQRTLYLAAVHGRRDIFESKPEEEGVLSGGGGNFMISLLQALHTRYYRQQRALLPSTERLERKVAAILEKNPEKPGEVATIFERHQRPMLRGWALLASNSHKAGIMISAFIPVTTGSFLSALGMGWYLLYDLGLSIVMSFLIYRQIPVDGRTLQELASPGKSY